jgi:hypothetical protein
MVKDFTMNLRRRDLLLSTLPVSAAFFLEGGLRPLAGTAQDVEQAGFDRDTYNFWTAQVHEPSQSFADHGRIVSSRGQNLPSEAEFLFYSADTGFVRATSTGSETPVTKTLLEKGDTSLLLSVDTIRPSQEHMQRLVSQKNGSLRVDLKQAFPLQQLSETLNWSAIAAMFPNESVFSGYHQIAFDPKSTWGQARKVPLPAGVGFWSWNFSSQPKPSMWSQVMGMIAGNKKGGDDSDSEGDGNNSSKAGKKVKALGATVLGLGMPAIAKTALSAFNELFGSMLAKGSPKTDWIIHNADTPLLATKESRQKHPGRAVALRSGSYLVVATTDTQQLLAGRYQLKDGVVVPVDTKDADLDAAAKSTLPEVSYIALSTVVESPGATS